MTDPTAADEWKAAWSVPIVSAIGYAAATTHIYSLGVFIEPIEREYGWTRSDITFGLTITSGVVVVFGALLGMIAIAGLCLYCSLFALLSVSGPSVWNWRMLWLLLGMGALGVQPVVWSTAVASRFFRSRGIALSIALSGGALSAAIAPVLASVYIDAFGWRGAIVALGGTLAVTSLPLVLLFFTSGPAPSPVATATGNGQALAQMLSSWRFMSLAAISFVMTGAMMATTVHFVPMLTAGGLARSPAAAAAGLIGLFSIAGRIIGGFLLDRFSGPIVAACIFILPVIGTNVLLWSQGGGMAAVIAAALFGLAVGGEVDVLAYMTSRYFGLERFGSLFALVGVAGTIGLGLGPLMGGLIFDLMGSYDLLLFSVMAGSILAALVSANLGPYPRPSPS